MQTAGAGSVNGGGRASGASNRLPHALPTSHLTWASRPFGMLMPPMLSEGAVRKYGRFHPGGLGQPQACPWGRSRGQAPLTHRTLAPIAHPNESRTSMPPMKLRSVACLLALGACGPQVSPAGVPTHAVSLPATPPVTPAAPSSSHATPPPPSSSAPSEPDAPPETLAPCAPALQAERVLPNSVRSLAVGPPPHVAILSDQPWFYDGKAWKQIPIPARLAPAPGEQSVVGIFFGRDNKPRLMGARWTTDASHAQQVYLRFREGAWQRDPKEIGRLGSGPDAGMYGVLGNDDPELVCKVGDACIIKRRTGWKTIPAGSEIARTWLCSGTVYVLDSKTMLRLQDHALVPLSWQFEGKGHETGFWADSDSSGWVSVASQNALYRYQRAAWSRHASPVKAPAALWGSTAGDLWVVGEQGAARLQQGRWCRVQGVSGPLEHAAGRTGEVWLGGKAGLWLVRSP